MPEEKTRSWAHAMGAKVKVPDGREGYIVGRCEYMETEVSHKDDRFYVCFDMADTDIGDWFEVDQVTAAE